MASEDAKYVDLVTKLHTGVMQQIPVQLRCGIRCTNPYNTAVQEFVRMQPQEQIPVMVLVLEGFALCDPLVEAFTPECLSSTELCSAYTRLSEAVRDPERSPRALKLL
ncbi:hypothetical protein COOONC_25263, partial [Cooperia oncophora]